MMEYFGKEVEGVVKKSVLFVGVNCSKQMRLCQSHNKSVGRLRDISPLDEIRQASKTSEPKRISAVRTQRKQAGSPTKPIRHHFPSRFSHSHHRGRRRSQHKPTPTSRPPRLPTVHLPLAPPRNGTLTSSAVRPSDQTCAA